MTSESGRSKTEWRPLSSVKCSLIPCSLQNGIILLVMAFLISPYGLPMAAIWLLGKVQDLKFAIQDLVYG